MQRCFKSHFYVLCYVRFCVTLCYIFTVYNGRACHLVFLACCFWLHFHPKGEIQIKSQKGKSNQIKWKLVLNCFFVICRLILRWFKIVNRIFCEKFWDFFHRPYRPALGPLMKNNAWRNVICCASAILLQWIFHMIATKVPQLKKQTKDGRVNVTQSSKRVCSGCSNCSARMHPPPNCPDHLA